MPSQYGCSPRPKERFRAVSATTNKRTGRPSKFSPELCRRILRLIAKGVPALHACRACSISFQTFRNYQQAHPGFAEKCRNALSDGIRRRVEIIEKCCRSKDESVALRAATWWLSHTPGSAEHFSESRKLELSGELNGKAAIQIVLPAKDGTLPAVEIRSPKQIENDGRD